MRAVLVRLLVVLVATCGSVAALDTAADALTPAQEYARSAFRATNHQRVDHDLDKLGRNRCLRRKAIAQAKKMANREEIFHQDLVALLSDCSMSNVGENVASGFATGKAAVKGWMDSPEHRLNILNPVYELMGIGARKAHGTWYICQLFGKKA